MIRCKTEITQRELDALIEIELSSEKNVRKRKISRIIFLVSAILLALLATNFHYNVAWATILSVLCVFTIFMATIGVKLEQKMILKMLQNKMDEKMKLGVREYEFNEKGVIIDSKIGHSENEWSVFKLWGTYKDYIYLKKFNDSIVLVNKNGLSDDNLNELITLLSTNVKSN
jgi:hypothetical protein